MLFLYLLGCTHSASLRSLPLHLKSAYLNPCLCSGCANVWSPKGHVKTIKKRLWNIMKRFRRDSKGIQDISIRFLMVLQVIDCCWLAILGCSQRCLLHMLQLRSLKGSASEATWLPTSIGSWSMCSGHVPHVPLGSVSYVFFSATYNIGIIQ